MSITNIERMVDALVRDIRLIRAINSLRLSLVIVPMAYLTIPEAAIALFV